MASPDLQSKHVLIAALKKFKTLRDIRYFGASSKKKNQLHVMNCNSSLYHLCTIEYELNSNGSTVTEHTYLCLLKPWQRHCSSLYMIILHARSSYIYICAAYCYYANTKYPIEMRLINTATDCRPASERRNGRLHQNDNTWIWMRVRFVGTFYKNTTWILNTWSASHLALCYVFYSYIYYTHIIGHRHHFVRHRGKL